MARYRRFHRWPTEIECRFSTEQGGTVEAVLVDFSYGGGMVRCDGERPPEGSEIILVLAPKKESVEIAARVVYLHDNEHLFGVEFYGSAEDKRAKLIPLFQRYVDDS